MTHVHIVFTRPFLLQACLHGDETTHVHTSIDITSYICVHVCVCICVQEGKGWLSVVLRLTVQAAACGYLPGSAVYTVRDSHIQ